MSTIFWLGVQPGDEDTMFARRSNNETEIQFTRREMDGFKLRNIIWGEDGSEYASVNDFIKDNKNVVFLDASRLNAKARDAEKLVDSYEERGGEWLSFVPSLKAAAQELRARAKAAARDGLSISELAEHLARKGLL